MAQEIGRVLPINSVSGLPLFIPKGAVVCTGFSARADPGGISLVQSVDLPEKATSPDGHHQTKKGAMGFLHARSEVFRYRGIAIYALESMCSVPTDGMKSSSSSQTIQKNSQSMQFLNLCAKSP